MKKEDWQKVQQIMKLTLQLEVSHNNNKVYEWTISGVAAGNAQGRKTKEKFLEEMKQEFGENLRIIQRPVGWFNINLQARSNHETGHGRHQPQ